MKTNHGIAQLTYGYFVQCVGGYYGVYPTSAQTGYGTVDEKHGISTHGTAEEAQAAIRAKSAT